MVLAVRQLDSAQESRRYASGTRTGVRTAENFTVFLGFRPGWVRVVNLTDNVEATLFVDPALDAGANAKSLVVSATGSRTYADSGIALTSDERGFTVTVATAGLETDDDDVFWEAGD